MDYTVIPPAEQAAAINRRLEGLERDHLEVSLDVEVSGPGGNPTQEARLEELEATITALRDRAEALAA